jgi:hypothetical protein
MTSGGVTVTAQLTGSLGGSNAAPDGGYRFNFNIGMAAGAAANVPACSILSSNPGLTQNLHDSSTSITTALFQMSYYSCAGFVDPPFPPGCASAACAPNFVTESSQLILARQ